MQDVAVMSVVIARDSIHWSNQSPDRCSRMFTANLPELRQCRLDVAFRVFVIECAGLLEVKAANLLDLLEDTSSQGLPRHAPAPYGPETLISESHRRGGFDRQSLRALYMCCRGP